MGIRDRPTSPRSPWQNGYAERLIGSIRRECVDHVVVLGERHLRHVLLSYMNITMEMRTHLSLEKGAPVLACRSNEPGSILAAQFSAGCTTNMSGFDFRQAQPRSSPRWSGLALQLLRPHLKADPAAPIFELHPHHLHQAAQRLVAGLAMERWTPHDLRRTAATILDRAGYSLEQIGALLAHTRKGVTAVYARWDKFDLRREMATVVEAASRAKPWTANRRRRSRPPPRRQSPKQHDERAAIAPPFSFRRYWPTSRLR